MSATTSRRTFLKGSAAAAGVAAGVATAASSGAVSLDILRAAPAAPRRLRAGSSWCSCAVARIT